MKKYFLITCILTGALLANAQTNQNGTTPPSPPDLKKTHQVINPIAPRYQWEHNGGYCGETSLVSAGLYYGQYVSQYDARALASPGMPQNSQTYPGVQNSDDAYYNAQLFLGVNDSSAAASLKLDADETMSQNSTKFLQWVKRYVVKGYPVVIGVFNNEYKLYSDSIPSAGDPEYDHIVPVIGWGSDRVLTNNDITDDEILFSDNGLHGTDTTAVPDSTIKYYYHYPIPYFLTNRVTANSKTGKNRIYSLLQLPKYQNAQQSKYNYAIAIRGVKDVNKETVPVRLTTDINYEAPAMASNSDTRPQPNDILLTITVSALKAGQTYNLYYYTDEKQVPVKDFNKESAENKIAPWKQITATANTWVGTLSIKSDQKAFFRAVSADGK